MTPLSTLHRTLQTLTRRLSALLPDLTNPVDWDEAKTIFTTLETHIRQTNPTEIETILSWPEIPVWGQILRRYRASYEYQQEKRWAEALLLHPRPTEKLAQYHDYPRYQTIARFEMDLLKQVGISAPRRVLFVGSGPLPVSAILLAQTFGLQVDCLDRSPEACRLAGRIFQVLGLNHRFTCRQSPILDYQAVAQYDVIFLAALVGLDTATKTEVLQHLGALLAPGQSLLIRCSHGLRTLIYAPLDLASLTGFDYQEFSQTPAGVIQSTVVATKTTADVGKDRME